jgi:ABC-type multidrug transport system fused ATPase/permease subunit
MYSRQHFPNQKPNEHVLMFLRRHWIVVLKIILIAIFFSAIPVLIYVSLANLTNYFDSEAFTAFFTLFISAFYLFVVLYTFTNFIDYYLDVWMVTNQRIINIEQEGLFNRIVAEKDLGRMQDITSEVHGFLGTILNYGDVYIQTAAEKERFIFRQVPFADEVARRISNLVSEYQKLNKNFESGLG